MKYNIMLVDDSRTALFMNSQMVKVSGIPIGEIITATNGKNALKKLIKKKVDVIITDMVMPEMDGFTFINILKNSPEFSRIPIIPVTSLGAHTDVEEFQRMGISSYLTKAISKEEMKRVLFKVLKLE